MIGIRKTLQYIVSCKVGMESERSCLPGWLALQFLFSDTCERAIGGQAAAVLVGVFQGQLNSGFQCLGLQALVAQVGRHREGDRGH